MIVLGVLWDYGSILLSKIDLPILIQYSARTVNITKLSLNYFTSPGIFEDQY